MNSNIEHVVAFASRHGPSLDFTWSSLIHSRVTCGIHFTVAGSYRATPRFRLKPEAGGRNVLPV